MAARSDDERPGKDRKALTSAVEDASHFLFEIDTTAPSLSAPRAAPNKASGVKAEAKPHYHDHRARLRERFEQAGAEALADYEILELLLFRVIPRRDTKPLAKALIQRFGDLSAVLGAPANLIAEVEGAGPAVAAELKVIQAVIERAGRAELKQRTIIGSWSQLVNYCRTSMAHAPREQFRVIFLDVKNQLIADEVLNEGTVDHAPVYPREVARRALELSAASVILVHNHPSGDPSPSAADVQITREIVAAAKAVGVRVHDHLVVGRNGASSFKTLGLL
ncbi:MAG TPA: DNA repair protein RadC [Caulobacterales bacterium]|nr:DNA repair protein RadC [Caulobacterales bacterium]